MSQHREAGQAVGLAGARSASARDRAQSTVPKGASWAKMFGGRHRRFVTQEGFS